MARKVDPLNKKVYGAVTAMLTVSDVKTATVFYQKAFGFTKRGIMNGPDGQAIHSGTYAAGQGTIMLSPGCLRWVQAQRQRMPASIADAACQCVHRESSTRPCAKSSESRSDA